MKYTPRQIRIARINLTHFVEYKARQVARDLGFSWVATDTAPSDMESLLAAWANSKRTKEPLPVWSGASEGTIYTHAVGNWAFRFWHDSLHCLYGLQMDFDDEIGIGAVHVDAVGRVFGSASLERAMMYADTIGQTIHCHRTGHFPENQLEFVINSIQQD